MTTRTAHLRDRLARRRASAEAGLIAALDALAAAQAELGEAVAAQIAFEAREHIRGKAVAREAKYARDRAARARRDAERHMVSEGVL